MPDSPRICLLSDAPKGAFARHLALLYPECFTSLDFREADHSAQALSGYTHVVTMVTHRRNLEKLDYAAVRAFAESGGGVVSCLFEYARFHGLPLSKTHVGDRIRPAIRICAENDITRGFRVGDVTPWWGKVSHAPNNTHPNQLFQRQIPGMTASEQVSILGTSTVNAGAVLIEEKVGKGRILALDLLSLMEPFYDSWGSANKFLFLGNLIGGSVRYGKHYPRKLLYDEFVAEMGALAQRLPALTLTREGPCSDGRPVCSLSLGRPDKPSFLFFGAIHGWEWENAYGLLHLAELLASEDPPEGLSRESFYLKVVPILNPYGYETDIRHNANGVDLNRNFDCAWQGHEGGEDLYVPWDFDYKGAAPASEPETRIAQRLIQEHKPLCVADFHTADYIMLWPHRGDEALLNAIHADFTRRLENRYLSQRPYSPEYEQVNILRKTDFSPPHPFLICYAAEAGTPASFVLEMSGNRTDTQALVMNVDTVVEVCLAAIQQCLARR
ncbi:MAG: DUF2817 domain-containing protein [Armatimonadetes bacterium]|nr:DUF2817 domain-containing protein [Armatimonadota bacterium]